MPLRLDEERKKPLGGCTSGLAEVAPSDNPLLPGASSRLVLTPVERGTKNTDVVTPDQKEVAQKVGASANAGALAVPGIDLVAMRFRLPH